MKKKIYLLVLSMFCVAFAHAEQEIEYVAPSDGVYRIINMQYGAAMMENFITNTVNCTAVGSVDMSGATTGGATIGGDDEYEQMWVLKQEEDGKFSIQNVFTGKYIQTGNNENNRAYWTRANKCGFNIKETKWGEEVCYNIWDPSLGNRGLHCNDASIVVRWEAETTKAASEWRFVKVNITDEQIAKVRAEYEDLMKIQEKREGYQTVLNEVFVDSACTILKDAYASKSADELRAALVDRLPAELVNMAVKVKTGEWSEDNDNADKPGWNSDYAKKFRVQLIEPHSIAGEITEWIGHQGHTNMDNPTGIYANKRGVLYVMVNDTLPKGAELWGCWINGHSKMPNYNNGYSNGVELEPGLNIIPFGNDGSAFYINYIVHTFDRDSKTFGYKLSDFPDLKVQIAGGYINGYYNRYGDALYKGDTDADWEYYEERANLDNITIVGRHQILQFELNDVTVTETKDGKTSTWHEDGLAKLFPDALMSKNLPNNQRINAVIDAWDRITLSEKMTLGVASKAEVDSMNLLCPAYDATWKQLNGVIYDYEGHAEYCNELKERDNCDYSEYYNHRALAFGTRSGYMYGSWDHSGYHINTTRSILVDIVDNAGSTWGPGHEIGHQHQASFTVDGLMEVTNNLFANISVWYMGMGTSRINGSEGNLEKMYKVFREGGDFFGPQGSHIWVNTQMYYRLWLYYHRTGHNPKFYPRLFELLRKYPMTRHNGSGGSETYIDDKGKEDTRSYSYADGKNTLLHFYKLCCEAAGEDLTEFFRAYGFFTVMTERFVGDYSNSKFNQSQADIDKAIQEVKAKGYPVVNTKALFIHDATTDRTYGHDGKTLRSFWDGETQRGENGEVGCYVDFMSKDGVTGKYLYSLANLRTKKLTIEGGDGAVGFAVFNKAGEIMAFSNNHSFVINDDVASMIRKGNADVLAITPSGEDIVVENKALQGTPEEQLERLKGVLATAKKYIAKSDATGTKMGYLVPDSVLEYSELIKTVEDVVGYADTTGNANITEFSFGEWYVTLDAANADIEVDATKRVPFVPYCFYSIAVVDDSNSKERYMEYTTSGLSVAECADEQLPRNMQWMIVGGEDGLYRIQHRTTGNYISAAKRSERATAKSTDIEQAGTFVLQATAPGEFALQPSNDKDLCLYSSARLQNQVFTGVSNIKWAVRMEDDMLAMPDTITEETIPVYYLLRTDNGEYAHYNTFGRFDKGRISSRYYDDPENAQFWFYFLKGDKDNTYAIYNFGEEMPIAIKEDSLLYVSEGAAPEYTIALDETETSYKLSTEQGCWFMDSLGARPLAELSTVTYTPWKLQYVRTVSLTNEPLREIVLSQTSVSLSIDDSLKLECTTIPEYATNHEVTWESNKPEFVTVDSTGLVKAVAVGAANITATAKDGSGVKATCRVTVKKTDNSISNIAAEGVVIQNQGGVITIAGLAKGAVVNVYDAAGKLIATAVAANGVATIDTGLTVGSTIIVKVQGDVIKTSLQ